MRVEQGEEGKVKGAAEQSEARREWLRSVNKNNCSEGVSHDPGCFFQCCYEGSSTSSY